MLRVTFITVLALFAFLMPARAQTEQSSPMLDVEHYDIQASVDLLAQTLEATVEVRFIPRDPALNASFELHNALNIDSVETLDGKSLSPIRYRQDSSVYLSFPETMEVDKPQTIRFRYGGRLVGFEDSPVEGYSLAEITAERAILTYAGRWFPVNGFGADRFSANMSITTQEGVHVLGSGIGTSDEVIAGVEHHFEFMNPSFPGTIAIVSEEPVKASFGDSTVAVYMPDVDESLALAYGEAAAELVEFYSGLYGLPYSKSLAIIEMGEYAPNGYWAPGMVLLSPYGRRQSVNEQLLGKLVAHQWWGSLIGAGNRNHLWLVDGTAQYSSLLAVEEKEGTEAFATSINDIRVEALTFDATPLRQSSLVGDFTPQMHALTAARGAMVLHMLRWKVGDELFFGTLNKLITEHTWTSITTDSFRILFEEQTGQSLDAFFLQWTESNGTPEFVQEYTIYRLGGNQGFLVIGKINQDMDTFSMPVELKIETEGEPEFQVVNVTGTSSDYSLETFGKPKQVILDPNHRILRLDEATRVRVAIRKGEQLVELGYYQDALIEYQQAIDINRFSSLAHYRVGEVFFLQSNFQSAANEFREALNGDHDPAWIEVWAHINLGKVFDVSGQRERAVNEYQLAVRTRDNTQNAQDEASKYLANPYRRPRVKERVY